MDSIFPKPEDHDSRISNASHEPVNGEESIVELTIPSEVIPPINVDQNKYWCADFGSHKPTGPFSKSEIQKRVKSGVIAPFSMVWCRGLSTWELIADHFEVSSLLDIQKDGSTPPPLINNFRSLTIPYFLVVLNIVATWNPPAYMIRFIARFVLACGLLAVILSLALMPFGMSWISGGLQILLIASVLEVAAMLRTTHEN